jgi:hypothetical protein
MEASDKRYFQGRYAILVVDIHNLISAGERQKEREAESSQVVLKLRMHGGVPSLKHKCS